MSELEVESGFYTEENPNPVEVVEEPAETVESTEEIKPEAESETVEVETKPEPKHGIEKRIQSLVAERNKARADKEAAEIALKKLEASLKSENEPNPEDYDTPVDFLKAYARYEAKLQRIQEKQELEQERLNQVSEKVESIDKQAWADTVSKFEEQVAEVQKTKYQDWEQKRAALPPDVAALSLPVPVTKAMMASPVGTDILYHFLSNPYEYASITQMEPYEALFALARLEAGFIHKPVQTITKVAPEPIKPLKGSAAPSKTEVRGKFY